MKVKTGSLKIITMSILLLGVASTYVNMPTYGHSYSSDSKYCAYVAWNQNYLP